VGRREQCSTTRVARRLGVLRTRLFSFLL
jgi:hypothetical protein